MRMIDLKRWFNNLSLSDRLLVQKFVIRLYVIGELYARNDLSQTKRTQKTTKQS
jgi:hypothetical protein